MFKISFEQHQVFKSINCKTLTNVKLFAQRIPINSKSVNSKFTLPKKVTVPSKFPYKKLQIFGFVENAERLNSRLSMIGFFGILFLEFLINKGILDVFGLNTGSGLGFEF